MQHLWVEMKITPVHLEADPEIPGNIRVMVEPNQEVYADEDASHACWVCGINPNLDNLTDECPGEKPPIFPPHGEPSP